MTRRLATLFAIASISCGGGDPVAVDQGTDPSIFLAFSTSFEGYHSWHTSPVHDVSTDGGVHTSGKRTEYINRLPSKEALEFPVGTIIVKEIEANDPAQSRTFAMVKRGGGYNSAGATGWEWFELKSGGSPPVIIWRGVGPPAGELYGGDPTGCNNCHMASRANHFVKSESIRLDKP